MIVALEEANSDLVPVIATFRTPTHHKHHQKASEARPDIDRDNLMLTLHVSHQPTRHFPMSLLAQGRYRPGGSNKSHLSLSVRDPQNADPHRLRQFLIRCFQPDLEEQLRRQLKPKQIDPAQAALNLAHQADHTVHALLQSRPPRQHNPSS